MFLAKLQ
jgi:hypothetical protein